MTQKTYHPPQKFLIAGLIALVAFLAPSAQAAFTNHLDTLRAELQSRSTALTDSEDKTEQKQKKAVDKAITTIDKPATSLATDVKTAGKLAKSLTKSFPSEFAASLVFSNDLSVILDNAFEDFGADVGNRLLSLSNTVSSLPDGKTKIKASVSVASAQVALAAAGSAPDYASVGKSLASALKAIASGIKSAGSGGGGGGGCTESTFTMTVSNEGPLWIADVPSASFRPDTSDLSIGGIRGLGTPFDTVAIGVFPANGQADNVNYVLGLTSEGGSSAYASGVTSTNAVVYEQISGTVHITAINAGPVGAINGTVSGTFSFSAAPTGQTNGVITLSGSFNICEMVTLPPLPPAP